MGTFDCNTMIPSDFYLIKARPGAWLVGWASRRDMDEDEVPTERSVKDMVNECQWIHLNVLGIDFHLNIFELVIFVTDWCMSY